MQDVSFGLLAAEAAEGLKGDREIYLEVCAQLRLRMEGQADQFARQGHEAAECVPLARDAFGSPRDVAGEVLAANRERLRRRAKQRLAFAVLVVPLALLLLLYLGYGREQRAQVRAGSSAQAIVAENMPLLSQMNSLLNRQEHKPPEKQRILPFWTVEYPLAKAPPMVRQLAGDSDNAPNILHYWEAHRTEPNSAMYYAYYTIIARSDSQSFFASQSTAPPIDKKDILLRGEQIEPDNALYPMLLAEYYLNKGILAQEDNTSRVGDILLDRRNFEQGLQELHKAVVKPYFHTYQLPIIQQRLNALPRPWLTEDYFANLSIANSSIDDSIYSDLRELSRCICGSRRLLLAEGRRADAQALTDSWRPMIELLLNDRTDNTQMQRLTTMALANMLTAKGAAIYDQLGETTKARDMLAIPLRLTAVKEQWKAEINAQYSGETRKHQPLMSMFYEELGPLRKLQIRGKSRGNVGISVELIVTTQ